MGFISGVITGIAVAQPAFVGHTPAQQVFGEPAGITGREPENVRVSEGVDLWAKIGPSFTYDVVLELADEIGPQVRQQHAPRQISRVREPKAEHAGERLEILVVVDEIDAGRARFREAVDRSVDVERARGRRDGQPADEEVIADRRPAAPREAAGVALRLFGDEAARTLGFTPRGLSPQAGLALALHDARARAFELLDMHRRCDFVEVWRGSQRVFDVSAHAVAA